MFKPREETWVWRRQPPLRCPQRPFRCLCWREPESIHRPSVLLVSPGVPVPPPTSWGGVWVRPRHGSHNPLRGSGFRKPHFDDEMKMIQTRYLFCACAVVSLVDSAHIWREDDVQDEAAAASLFFAAAASLFLHRSTPCAVHSYYPLKIYLTSSPLIIIIIILLLLIWTICWVIWSLTKPSTMNLNKGSSCFFLKYWVWDVQGDCNIWFLQCNYSMSPCVYSLYRS